MAERKIINAISSARVPCWGNQKKYIAVHYLGVDGQAHDLAEDGCGAHFFVYWDGTIYQRCSLDAVPWAVGTARTYTQKHPEARNSNTISIEMCCHNTGGDSTSAMDPKWWFTTETQESCVWLVKKLMKDLGIPASHVLRHWDIVNKVCPNPYVLNNKFKTSWTWDEFKAKLAESETYYVRKSFSDKASQIGSYTYLENAKKACRSGYHVYDANGKLIYSPPVFQRGARYRMSVAMAVRKEPSASSALVEYDNIPVAKRRFFQKGGSGEAIIKKGTVDKCRGERQVGTRGTYMRISRGWILAEYKGKRVEKV